MKRATVQPAILLLGVLASGCAPYFAPYGGRLGYPMPRPYASFAADGGALARGRWDNVMRLPARARIDVLTWDGLTHVGDITFADGGSLRLMARGIEEQISRADIVRVDLIDLPGSEMGAVTKSAAGGALLGIAIVGLVTGVIGGEAWPPPAAALRAGAAYGAVAGGAAGLSARRGRIVYLAEDLRSH